MVSRVLISTSALLVILGVGGLAAGVQGSLAPAVALDEETVSGEIKSVEENVLILDVDGEPMRIRLGESTAITLDGETSNREEALQEGRRAIVAHEDGLATKVDVLTRAG